MTLNSGYHFNLARDKNFTGHLRYLQPTVKTALMFPQVFPEMKRSLEAIFTELNCMYITFGCWSVANIIYCIDEDLNKESVALAYTRMSGICDDISLKLN